MNEKVLLVPVNPFPFLTVMPTWDGSRGHRPLEWDSFQLCLMSRSFFALSDACELP